MFSPGTFLDASICERALCLSTAYFVRGADAPLGKLTGFWGGSKGKCCEDKGNQRNRESGCGYQGNRRSGAWGFTIYDLLMGAGGWSLVAGRIEGNHGFRGLTRIFGYRAGLVFAATSAAKASFLGRGSPYPPGRSGSAPFVRPAERMRLPGMSQLMCSGRETRQTNGR